MNQGRIWCVVNPTVGLPLFLGSVAVTSLIVHTAVLTNTTWFAAFLNGGKAKTAQADGTAPAVAAAAVPGVVVTLAPSAASPGAAFVVTVTPAAVQPDPEAGAPSRTVAALAAK